MKRLFSFTAARRDVPRQDMRVTVTGGYHPEVLHAASGRPVQITFRREESLPCSESVHFPDFGLEAQLPQGEDVTVELPPAAPGAYDFECGMGMLRGRLVLEPAPERRGEALGKE